MVVHPLGWQRVGQPVRISDIENTLYSVLSEIDVHCLSLSGGLDSSLMLFYMEQLFGDRIRTFTIALNEKHPDYVYAEKIARWFEVDWEPYIVGDHILERLEGDYPGDEVVRTFYRWLKEERGVQEIIACDGIDEYMCGYYDHQKNPGEEIYFDYIRRLKDEHLVPLNKNSGDVKVWLPYLDPDLLFLLLQIPIKEKVDSICRKKVVVQMAEGKIPREVVERPKYGFCDAMRIKE